MVGIYNIFYTLSHTYRNLLTVIVLKAYVFILIFAAADALGGSKHLRRFGQSIKRVVREVKEQETSGTE
jgi:hypothetical protein